MNDQDLELAEQVGLALHYRRVDVNEVKKLTAFLRRRAGDSGGPDLRTLLDRLIQSAGQFRYSNQTIGYHRDLREVITQSLHGIDDSLRLQFILGWAARLMRHYGDGNAPPSQQVFQGPVQSSNRSPGPSFRSGHNQGRGGGQRHAGPPLQTAPPPPPPKLPLKIGEELLAKVERIEGTLCIGTAKAHEIQFEQTEPPAKVGDRFLVIVENQRDGHWTVRLKTKK